MASLWSSFGQLLGLKDDPMDQAHAIGNQPTPILNPNAYSYPTNNPEVQRLQDQEQYSQGISGPQLNAPLSFSAQQNQGIDSQDRQAQSQYAGMLGQAAAGGMPSMAQAQLGQARDQSLADQMSMSASARGDGLSGAMAQRAAQLGQSRISSNYGYQAAMLAAQEQAQARGQLGQALTSQRAGDLQSFATQRAANLQAQGMSLERAVAQAHLESQQRQLNQQRQFGYLGAGQNAASMQMNAQMALAQQQAELEMRRRAQAAGIYQTESNANTQLAGGVASGVGSLGAGMLSSGGGAAAGGGAAGAEALAGAILV